MNEELLLILSLCAIEMVRWAHDRELPPERVSIARVVHCKREPYDVYIGRPSKWGNPIKLTKDTPTERKQVLAAYRSLVESGYLADVLGPNWRETVRKELGGKVLGCWCAPKPCHGDILLEIANAN